MCCKFFSLATPFSFLLPGKKYICISVTPIPWYRYPDEGQFLNTADPESSGLRRGEWVTASQHNDKWLCTDSGGWLPIFVNGVKVRRSRP